MLEKVDRMNELYDFYGPLLTAKQQKIFELYYHEDFSLGEIAEEEKTSRQAVHDILRRVSVILEEYEKKLSLADKFHKVRIEIKDIDLILDEVSIDLNAIKEKLKTRISSLLEQLG